MGAEQVFFVSEGTIENLLLLLEEDGGGGGSLAARREWAQLCRVPRRTWEQSIERTRQRCLQQWQELRVRLSN